MPGIFDNFNASQANNGQAPPSPQATSGAPGFPFGSWGNQPPNMAGGLQQFLASRGMARPQPGALAPAGAPPGVQGGVNVAPQLGQSGGNLAPQPGQSGVALPPGVMPQQPGMPMNASQGPSSAAVMPQGAMAGASSPYGATNFAGGMQPFVGARR